MLDAPVESPPMNERTGGERQSSQQSETRMPQEPSGFTPITDFQTNEELAKQKDLSEVFGPGDRGEEPQLPVSDNPANSPETDRQITALLEGAGIKEPEEVVKQVENKLPKEVQEHKTWLQKIFDWLRNLFR